MTQVDYTFEFDDISSTYANVRIVDRVHDRERTISLAIDDGALQLRRTTSMLPILADLLDLAVAVHTVDHLAVRQGDSPSRIHVVVPVREPSVFTQPDLSNQLHDLLRWYTEDEWSFEFVPRNTGGRATERRNWLRVYPQRVTEVALWSGGLDSLAGLYNKLREYPATRYILVGTGGNPHIQRVQQQVANAARDTFHVTLTQIRILTSGTRGWPKNQCPRSRGLVFKLLGAICAYLEGQDTLHIYENGIGAINLPYLRSEVGLDHTRAVHPLSLIKTSRFLSILLGTSFEFQNSFLFHTKAQMCKVFAYIPEDRAARLVALTFSCDRRHRKPGQPPQCGYCTSCLLRRQALEAARIRDDTLYVITSHQLHGRKRKVSDEFFFRAMASQVATLRRLLNSFDPWHNLSVEYPDLPRIVDELSKERNADSDSMRMRLCQMYSSYVNEWESVEDVIGQGFLQAVPESGIMPIEGQPLWT